MPSVRGVPRAAGAWYADPAMVFLLRFLRDLIVAFAAPRAMLVAENLLLRQQVIVLRRRVTRPRLRPFDRWLLGTLAGTFRGLLEAVIVVKPATLIRTPRRLAAAVAPASTRPLARASAG